MDSSKLKRFAQSARVILIAQVDTQIKHVLAEGSSARREHPQAVKKLEEVIRLQGNEQVIEQVAYTWFNRFCALRFMDVNNYTSIKIVTPADNQTQPEILAEAKMGYIDKTTANPQTKQYIFDLLSGKAPSPDGQGEAYRLLLTGACNSWHRAMPFLFEKIDDYTELLLPYDLLTENSVLTSIRSVLTAETCKNVEVIGWLYQFYISEKKDQVFERLKKNIKIKPSDIPAATQLFTPHWIVRYLVENSLGRLWMLNRPGSQLVKRMDYYIKPNEPETDFLRVGKPEEIKVCDPACGSGHMLVYAFDLLYAIYEEEGYQPDVIADKIFANNLYGIEIDKRAGQLSAFALVMKAREKQAHFFSKPEYPNICVLENIDFSTGELNEYINYIGRDLFTLNLQETLYQFKEADNFGSLIRPKLKDVSSIRQTLESKQVSGNLFLSQTHQKVLKALEQVDYLGSKYHVVIANPPYINSSSMNPRLGAWAKDNYPNSKSDLFAMFIERNTELAVSNGYISMITMQSWMFLSSFENLRGVILQYNTLISMIHLGPRAFDSIGGEVVSTTAFLLKSTYQPDYQSVFIRVVDGTSEAEKVALIQEAINNPDCDWLYQITSNDFNKIPGSPIAYWVESSVFQIFKNSYELEERFSPRQGMATGDNSRFVRDWFEVGFNKITLDCKTFTEARNSGFKWFPYNKGGGFRKWYGNRSDIIVFDNRNYQILKNQGNHCPSEQLYFNDSIGWSKVSSGNAAFRMYSGFIFDVAGCSIFGGTYVERIVLLGYLNSLVSRHMLKIFSPTLNFEVGAIRRLPIMNGSLLKSNFYKNIELLVSFAKIDWDYYETSWDFTSLPLLQHEYRKPTLKDTYKQLRKHWQSMTSEMQRLEEENNRIFIEAYGLQEELTPEVPLKEITLTCNPHYRYGNEKTKEQLEDLLAEDTMREFISYAVGCMFGRFALEKPGLVLANQGETYQDYLSKVPDPVFPADKNNIIPILDKDWFADDITELFYKFLRTTFGNEHFQENLDFIETAIGKDIRKYFLKDFYNDHVRRYQKRPIYWLFSSPKGSFNALIYMHRYQPDTISILLNEYVREYRAKLGARLEYLGKVEVSVNASKTEKVKALKEIQNLKAVIGEIEDWEREVIYPLATRKIEIDLDDGVKVNYAKFPGALKRIPGLEAKEKD